MPPRRSPLTDRAIALLMQGPTSPAEIDKMSGWATIKTFLSNGLIEVDRKEELPGGGNGRTFYRFTEDGWYFALDYRPLVVRTGECCEDAILGIEGDHAPYCPVVRAQGSGPGAALPVQVGSLPQGAPVDQGVAVG